MHGFDVELYFYKSLERTRTLLGKTITANVKDATAELREAILTAKAEADDMFASMFAPKAYLVA